MNNFENKTDNDIPETYLTRKKFLLLGTAFTLCLTILSWAIITFIQDSSIYEKFINSPEQWMLQISTGFVYGTAGSLFIMLLIQIKFLYKIKLFFLEIIQSFRLKIIDIIIISLFAGFSEELFFRATLQTYLGIWLTSLIFIGLHGYINPFNWRMSIVGAFMIVVSAGLGYLYEYYGLLSAITAHSIFDMFMLYAYVFYYKND